VGQHEATHSRGGAAPPVAEPECQRAIRVPAVPVAGRARPQPQEQRRLRSPFVHPIRVGPFELGGAGAAAARRGLLDVPSVPGQQEDRVQRASLVGGHRLRAEAGLGAHRQRNPEGKLPARENLRLLFATHSLSLQSLCCCFLLTTYHGTATFYWY